jgi:hypothetical protein
MGRNRQTTIWSHNSRAKMILTMIAAQATGSRLRCSLEKGPGLVGALFASHNRVIIASNRDSSLSKEAETQNGRLCQGTSF